MKYAVIMAGGYGTRFWPLSRKNRPKQCLPIVSKRPMIKETVDRLKNHFDEVVISTGKDMSKEIKKVLPGINYIVEPMPRNTAACIGLSAIKLLKKDKDAIMFLETADHVYNDVKKYVRDVKAGLDYASKHDKIILIGIKPTQPHTGYGYIKAGSVVYNKNIKISKVSSFKEKPDFKTAKSYLKTGKYLWNSGMFISKCSVMLDEIKKLMPKLYVSLKKISDSNFNNGVMVREFKKLDKISIDYGVMEKSKKTLVIGSSMHWDDVGDLASFDRFIKKDKNGNVVKGIAYFSEARDNIVIVDRMKNKKNVSLLGVDDLIVVVTDDEILVTNKKSAQDVKKMIRG